MKRRHLVSFGLLFLLYCSCYPDNEEKNQASPLYNEILLNGGYVKDGIITITAIDSQQLLLDINFTVIAANRPDDSVSCFLSGLPAGITASSSSGNFKLPAEWKTYLDVNIDTGVYILNLNVNNLTGANTYPFKLHVVPPLPPPNCAICMIGTWSSMNNCKTETCTVVFDTIPGMPEWVSIRNIDCLGDSVIVNAHVSCDSGITIPKQTTHGYTISGNYHPGTGLCDYTFITIPDTVINNNTHDTSYCTFHITR